MNLIIEDGSFTVFVGPSDCGKSTLLRTIAGLEQITRGELQIDGARMNDADPIERGVAMVFQNYALYPHMTVEQNIGFSLRMAGLDKAAIAARVAAAAQTLRIEPLMARKPGQLPSGQRQRVAIGRAIVRDPEVFLFDEPLSNLDAELRVSMRVEIAKLHNKLGSTMIYVTHDQTETMTLADKIVVMRAGKVEQSGVPRGALRQSGQYLRCRLSGSPRMNFLRGRFEGGALKLDAGGQLASAQQGSGEVVVGVRLAHFAVSEPGDGQLSVLIDVVENLGGASYLYGSVASGEPVVIEVRYRPGTKAGDTVNIDVWADRAMLFHPNGKRLCPAH
ncbi:MAG: ABC transporter ATP-binding protein [Candidatus Devosia euplotis]|nr:ABC transporter ATP-binding protein [Candidatus Devosia euplotis]